MGSLTWALRDGRRSFIAGGEVANAITPADTRTAPPQSDAPALGASALAIFSTKTIDIGIPSRKAMFCACIYGFQGKQMQNVNRPGLATLQTEHEDEILELTLALWSIGDRFLFC